MKKISKIIFEFHFLKVFRYKSNIVFNEVSRNLKTIANVTKS